MAARRVVLNGKLLRAARLRAKMTLEQLAHRAKVSWLTIQRAETGGTKSSRQDTVDRIADALGINGEALVTYEWVERHEHTGVDPVIRKRRSIRRAGKKSLAQAMAEARRSSGDD